LFLRPFTTLIHI